MFRESFVEALTCFGPIQRSRARERGGGGKTWWIGGKLKCSAQIILWWQLFSKFDARFPGFSLLIRDVCTAAWRLTPLYTGKPGCQMGKWRYNGNLEQSSYFGDRNDKITRKECNCKRDYTRYMRIFFLLLFSSFTCVYKYLKWQKKFILHYLLLQFVWYIHINQLPDSQQN